MVPTKVFLGGAPADAEILEQLAQALEGRGVTVETGTPPLSSGPAEFDAAPPALVVVLSTAALASAHLAPGLERYEALIAQDPATLVVPVLLDPLPPESLPPWLREVQPLTASGDASQTGEVIIREVLQRLGLNETGNISGVVAPLVGGVPLDTVPLPALPLDTVPLPAVPLDTVPLPAMPLDTVPLAAISPDTSSLDTSSLDTVPLAVPPPDTSSLDTTPLAVPPLAAASLAAASLDTVPLTAAPAVSAASQQPPGALMRASSPSWRQRLQQRRRPLAIGAAASLILLLIACVAFSLGVGAPGGSGADRLESGLPGGPTTAASPVSTATITPTPSALPSPRATKVKPTATGTHGTPTVVVPTSTPVPPTVTPTPTLVPGTGLHGDYFHSTKVSPGTPVPYPNFGSLWFSQTDPIIYFGYGQQRRTYTPLLGPFDSRVCPNPPTSSPCSPFGVRWTGFVRPRYTETYTFTTDADDGVKLWVNGQLLVDNWQIQPDTQNSGTISLTAGQLVPIQIEYYENGQGPATMVLQWQSASQAFEAIPQSQLYPPS